MTQGECAKHKLLYAPTVPQGISPKALHANIWVSPVAETTMS